MNYRNNSIILLKKIKQFFLLMPFLLLSGCANMGSLSDISNLLKPTSVDQVTYTPVCEKSWIGKTVFFDFETNHSYWQYASDLAEQIKDQLIEDVVEDGCFHVQDRSTGAHYAYKVGIRIFNPHVSVDRQRVISQVSAQFRIKTYDRKDNLVKAITRDVSYKRPMFAVVVGDSQSKLLSNYANNVSVEIRKLYYKRASCKTKGLS